jgi:hypothetical protein
VVSRLAQGGAATDIFDRHLAVAASIVGSALTTVARALIDMAWGGVLTAACASAGKWATAATPRVPDERSARSYCHAAIPY